MCIVTAARAPQGSSRIEEPAAWLNDGRGTVIDTSFRRSQPNHWTVSARVTFGQQNTHGRVCRVSCRALAGGNWWRRSHTDRPPARSAYSLYTLLAPALLAAVAYRVVCYRPCYPPPPFEPIGGRHGKGGVPPDPA